MENAHSHSTSFFGYSVILGAPSLGAGIRVPIFWGADVDFNRWCGFMSGYASFPLESALRGGYRLNRLDR